MIKAARDLLSDDSLALAMSWDYKLNHFDNLSIDEQFQLNNIYFISENFTFLASTDNFFKYLFRNPSRLDKAVGNFGYGRRLVGYVVGKEEIEKNLWNGNTPITTNPDWAAIRNTIANKYDKHLADSLISTAKTAFFLRTKNCDQYVTHIEELMNTYPPSKTSTRLKVLTGGLNSLGDNGDSWALNGCAWTVFQICDKRRALMKGLKWSQLSIDFETDPNVVCQYLDTKANLLYKLGRRKDAIETEELAIMTVRKATKGTDKDSPLESEYKENLEKMKKNVPTWPQAR